MSQPLHTRLWGRKNSIRNKVAALTHRMRSLRVGRFGASAPLRLSVPSPSRQLDAFRLLSTVEFCGTTSARSNLHSTFSRGTASDQHAALRIIWAPRLHALPHLLIAGDIDTDMIAFAPNASDSHLTSRNHIEDRWGSSNEERLFVRDIPKATNRERDTELSSLWCS